MKNRSTALVIAGAVCLAGCGSRYDPDKCFGVWIDDNSSTRGADNCIVEWSHKLARGSDAANVIADGVLWVCRGPIKEAVAEKVDEGENSGSAWVEERRQAIFHAVEERAGHCSEK